MKIKHVSDLHLEWTHKYMELPNNTGADVLVLGGDICVGGRIHQYEKFFKEVSEQYKNVIYIPGNHEFYAGELDRTCGVMEETLHDIWKLDNIHFQTDNFSVTIDDVRFICSTLWTDCGQGKYSKEVESGLNDYRFIKMAKREFTRIYASDTMKLHADAVKFIFDISDTYKELNEKQIVITHHLPSELSIDPRYKDDTAINTAYFSPLDDKISERDQIKYWLHGHVHCKNDYRINQCRVLSNPRGYVSVLAKDRENPYFNEDFMIGI